MTPPELSAIPYRQFLADIETLAAAIGADAWRPDLLVGLSRGGLVPAVYLSHRLGVPMQSLDLSAQTSFVDEHLAMITARCSSGRRALLIDDINDTGATLLAVTRALAAIDAPEENIRAAVLIDNVRSAARASYRARTIDRTRDKRWFVFPWEAVGSCETVLADAVSMPERLR